MIDRLRADPSGFALFVILLPAIPLMAGIYAAGLLSPLPAPPPPVHSERDLPPAEWRERAHFTDTIDLEGVEYWADPAGTYAGVPSHAFRGIVFHFTRDVPAYRLALYSHTVDRARGGSFGYHYLIAKDGRILQAAPLGKRTNHIMPPGHRVRRPGIAPSLSNSNSVGISFVGACVGRIMTGCDGEQLTASQIRSGVRLTQAVQRRFGLRCDAVWGHGELQTSRSRFEGQTMTGLIRRSCQ